MQGAGEGLEIERRGRALNHPGVRIDVDRLRTTVRIADRNVEGEVGFVGTTDTFNDGLWFGCFDRCHDLVIAEQRRIVRRLAGAHLRVGQPDDFLADHRQRAGDTDDQDKEPDR
ncbi:hypothetical protein D3C72_705450 [compost metagenome]